MNFPFPGRQPSRQLNHRPFAPRYSLPQLSSSRFTSHARKGGRVTATPGASSVAGPSTPPGPVLLLTPPSSSLRQLGPIASDDFDIVQQLDETQELGQPPSSSVDSVFTEIKHYLLPAKARRLMPCAPLFRIFNVALDTFEVFLSTHGECALLNHTKIEYDPSARLITVCAPPTPYHDCSPSFLQTVLSQLQQNGFDTPSRQETLQVTQISWRAPDGSYLVPDAAVTVLDEREDATAPPRLFPTIVVEVANSQLYDDAVKKVRRWFRASAGLVEVVLLVNFTEKDPLQDAACFIEVYRCRHADPASDADSDSSTAAYRPPTDPPLLDVYRDGDRTDVIPPLDSPEDCVVLRYSDFFGSENVPVDRDAAEPVVLQLRILRMKINSLVRLTRAQNESLKRKAGRDEEGTEKKRVRADEA